MAENLLTVAALRTAVEAELIRSKLAGAGIEAALVEPEAAAEGAPTARVQVQVSPPDFERAMQLLFPIPQLKPSARQQKPAWTCPKCGEEVLGQFPACWSCGTGRDGAPAAGGAALPPAAPIASPAVPSMPPNLGGLPPSLAARLSPSPSAPPAIDVRPLSPQISSPAAASKPALNGEASSKAVAPRPPRTAEDEAIKIVVPAWDMATGKGRGGARRSSAQKAAATEADDRAARRAWWAALAGIIIWPLLIYSACIVLTLGLTNRPLSSRGNRFFYGALAVNALFLAAVFAWLGTHR